MDGHTASYRLHLRNADGKGANSGPTLGYWCMVPGICMRELQAMGVRSIVLTSGTLSPLESFAHELARDQLAQCAAADDADAPRCSKFPFRFVSRTRTSFRRRRCARAVPCSAQRALTLCVGLGQCALCRSDWNAEFVVSHARDCRVQARAGRRHRQPGEHRAGRPARILSVVQRDVQLHRGVENTRHAHDMVRNRASFMSLQR